MRLTSLVTIAAGIALIVISPVAARQQPGPSAAAIPGRSDDGRVAALAFALATAGLSRCPRNRPAPGIVLQHLTQFRLPDRPGMVAAYALDRGPGVVAVVANGPAAKAGIRPGDVLLALDGLPLPPEPWRERPFDQAQARARADLVLSLLAERSGGVAVTVLRDGQTLTLSVVPVPACPSRVHLARSDQRNAYADGEHVFLTTRLLQDVGNDAELGFVIAHEMAHNILGHAAAMRAGGVKRGLGRTLGASGKLLRQAERDADALGAEIMLDAGLDPVAGAQLLRRLDGPDLGITLFTGHDSIADRIATMRLIVSARQRR